MYEKAKCFANLIKKHIFFELHFSPYFTFKENFNEVHRHMKPNLQLQFTVRSIILLNRSISFRSLRFSPRGILLQHFNMFVAFWIFLTIYSPTNASGIRFLYCLCLYCKYRVLICLPYTPLVSIDL